MLDPDQGVIDQGIDVIKGRRRLARYLRQNRFRSFDSGATSKYRQPPECTPLAFRQQIV
jgi:hypothetical protein